MKFSITIASDPALDHVYAELTADAQNWADLTQVDGTLRLEMYPNPTGQPWMFDLDLLLAHLLAAKRALAGEVDRHAANPELS